MSRDSREQNYILYWIKKLRSGTFSSDDVANDSTVNGGAGSVSDALEAIFPAVNPLRISVLPSEGVGDYKINSTAHNQDNLHSFTYDGVNYQAAVWVNNDMLPLVAIRTLDPPSLWTKVSLDDVLASDVFNLPTADDSHNTYQIIVDNNGIMHVAGNHHNTALQYATSDAPMPDLSGFTAASMTGSAETSVTYVQFVKNRVDGTIYAFYREGGSGAGNEHFNVYDDDTETWSAPDAIFIDGESTDSPYLHRVSCDSQGALHVFFMWRATGDPSTNHDLCYAKYEGGVWKKSDGTAYSMPITQGTAEIVVNTAASGSGILNQCGADVDSNDLPHAAITLYDGDTVTQINHVYLDEDGAWHTEQVTNWDRGVFIDTSTTDGAVMRPIVFCVGTRTFIYFAHKYTKRRGSIRCIEVTPGTTDFVEFRLADLDPGEGDIIYDSGALNERGELSMFFQPSWNVASDSIYQRNCFEYQIPLVMTYNLDSIDLFKNGIARIPRIEVIDNASNMSTPTVSGEGTTSTTGVSSGPKVAATEEWENGIVYLRHTVRGTNASASQEVKFWLEEDGEDVSSNDHVYGEIQLFGTTNKTGGSPWMPSRTQFLYDWTDPGDRGGVISGRFATTNAGNQANTSIHTITVGILRLDEPNRHEA